MDHGEHAMAVAATDLHSTFEGHVLPGSMFILWALIWIAQRLARGDQAARASLEWSAVLPVLKIVLPLIGVWVEIPGERWGPTATLMSLQHVTMYSAFALTGVVDLLAYKKLLPAASTYVAFAVAQTNAGFLFWSHAIHGGVDGVVHRILAGAFFVVGVVAVLEARRASVALGWLRIGAQLVLGGWFILGAWVLYLSGWELDNPVNEGRSSMIFSWLVMLASVVVVSAWVVSVRRSAPAAEARVG
ncbi:MAG: hypothetical protein AB7T31_06135 [Gemmatimonadales bacterium]